MGVYIKGMEMPKSCGNCFFDTHCDNWRLRNWGAPPPDDCPLVPVPPHGRLIDADELSAKLNMMLSMAFGKGNTAFHFAYRSLWKMVENAPTIIEAEEGK